MATTLIQTIPNDMWNPGYTYYYDGRPKCGDWWRKDSNGNYYIWSNIFGLRWLDPLGLIIKTHPSDNAIQYYQNNPKPPHHDTHIPTPIDDEVKMFILMTIAYFVYKNAKRKTVSV